MNNKEIVRRFSIVLWEQRDLSIIDELFIAEPMIRSPLNPAKGCLSMREIAERWLEAFPDIAITWLDFIAENDKVVSRWFARGTHLGSFFDTRPTHKEVSYSGVTTFVLQDQKIVEYAALVDIHSILKQLGVASLAEAID